MTSTGSYLVTYTATDNAGNSEIETIQIYVNVLTDLEYLFPSSTSEFIDVSTNETTTTYTLLSDLKIVSELQFSSANIPNTGNNIVFDGNNHTITYDDGVLSNGLFKTYDSVSNDITIKRLTIKGGKTTDDSGFICASRFGKRSSGEIIILNCDSSGELSGYNSGGICGISLGEESTGSIYIEHCYSSGDITGESSGGIVGAYTGNQLYGQLHILQCYTSGSITGLNSGGITGSYFGNTSTSTNDTTSKYALTLYDCYSTGVIGTTNNNNRGILGAYSANELEGNMLIEKCYSSGNIISENSGGIIALTLVINLQETYQYVDVILAEQFKAKEVEELSVQMTQTSKGL